MERFTIQKSDFSQETISQIVAIHRKEIGQGFLSSLGDKALQLIFSLAAESESGVLLVARDTAQKDQAGGFLLGTFNTNAFYKDFLLRKSLAAVFGLIPKLLSFERLRKALETLLYPTKEKADDMPQAELFDIAVLKEYQGTGMAQMLFHCFSDTLAERGFKEFKITTGESLVRAQRFYESLGAQIVASIEIHKGQRTLVYVYRIPNGY